MKQRPHQQILEMEPASGIKTVLAGLQCVLAVLSRFQQHAQAEEWGSVSPFMFHDITFSPSFHAILFHFLKHSESIDKQRPS